MKKSKWLKWKIGGGVVCSLALVMQATKTDPAFEKAHQAALQSSDSSDGTEKTASNDQVMDEWKNESDKQSANEVAQANSLPDASVAANTSSVEQQTSHLSYAQKLFDLRQMVKDVVTQMHSSAVQKGVHLSLADEQVEEPLPFRGDVDRIRQLLYIHPRPNPYTICTSRKTQLTKRKRNHIIETDNYFH